jgi:hypothetical protein
MTSSSADEGMSTISSMLSKSSLSLLGFLLSAATDEFSLSALLLLLLVLNQYRQSDVIRVVIRIEFVILLAFVLASIADPAICLLTLPLDRVRVYHVARAAAPEADDTRSIPWTLSTVASLSDGTISIRSSCIYCSHA